MQMEHGRQRKKLDLLFKLSENLRARLSMALRRGYKTTSAVKDLGCSLQEFKVYLESKFPVSGSGFEFGYPKI